MNNNYLSRLLAIVVYTSVLPHATDVDARQELESGPSQTFANAVVNADAIIHGIVSNINYRLSGRSADSERVPHVFVTYEIMDTLRGRVPYKSLTLRFVGGPDGQGGLLLDPSVPMFNVGDEDVLLISRNGEVACPLINCLAGRLRIYGGKVYNGNGLPALEIIRDQLRYGSTPETELLKAEFPTPGFDELLRNENAMNQMRQQWPDADMLEMRRLYESQRLPTNLIEYAFSPADEVENAGSLASDDPNIEIIPPQPKVQEREEAIDISDLVSFIYDARQDTGNSSAAVPVRDLNPDATFLVPTPGSPAAPFPDVD